TVICESHRIAILNEQADDQGSMINVASVDPHAYASSLCAQAASEKHVVLAEVFVRVAESWRSERLDREPFIHQSRRETGVALRVWDRQGHEGLVHADDVAHR